MMKANNCMVQAIITVVMIILFNVVVADSSFHHDNNQNSRLLQNSNPDPWYIARIGDINVQFADGDSGEVTVYYEINKDKAETSTVITLYEFDCITPVPVDSVEVVTAAVDLFTTVSDPDNLSAYRVEINILEATIMGTTLWNSEYEDTNYDGAIQFCVKAELVNNGGNSVVFRDTKIVIPTTLTSNFEIDSFSVETNTDEDIAIKVADITYTMVACRCDINNACTITADTKVQVNSAIRICVKSSSDEVLINNVLTFNLNQGGAVVRSPITNGVTESGDLTSASVDNGEVTLITRLTSDFFTGEVPADITANGVVQLEFNNTVVRRHLQDVVGENNGSSTTPYGKFTITIPLEPIDEDEEKSDTTSCNFVSITSLLTTLLFVSYYIILW